MEMKLGLVPRLAVSALDSRLCKVMPSADENAPWLESTAMMSFHRQTDQNPP